MSSPLDCFLLLADLKRSANEHTPKALQRMTAKAFEKAFGELEPESRMANELHSGFNMSEASSVSEPEPESIKFARLMIGSLSYDLASGPEHIKAREAACVVPDIRCRVISIGRIDLFEGHIERPAYSPW